MNSSAHQVALAFDFDNTIAKTYEQSFGTRNVQTAYEYAIQDLFGDEGVVMYRAQGGLLNRAPTEIIVALGVEPDRIIEMTNQLVDRKLSYLLPEIGKPLENGGIWPRLTAGFEPFWQSLEPLVQEKRVLTAVVSNGHARFISKVFEVHGLSLPNVLVTDDDVRTRDDVAVGRRHKPDPLILEIAAKRLGIPKFTVYIGDNLVSDGGMARKAGISFGHYDEPVGRRLQPVNGGFRFGDWRVLIDQPSAIKLAVNGA